MKRFLVIMLAISYLCISIGITVHVHYCMGKMVAVNFGDQKDSHHCPRCGMDKKASKKGCCKDEHKIIKSTSDQVLAKDIIAKIHLSDYAHPLPTYNFYSNDIPATCANKTEQAHAPPPVIIPGCPIYLRIGNFRV
jgi:hypothetical protein